MASTGGALTFPPGVALVPEDFVGRLERLRSLTGLSWEGLAVALGVDSRQILRWRQGGAPNGGAMLSLVQVGMRVPGGLAALTNEDVTVVWRRRR